MALATILVTDDDAGGVNIALECEPKMPDTLTTESEAVHITVARMLDALEHPRAALEIVDAEFVPAAEDPSISGHIAVIHMRLEALYAAIDGDDREQARWEFDRVARAIAKLEVRLA